jgi:uncharacterized membrane protein YgcG
MTVFREQHAKDPQLGVLVLLIKEDNRLEIEVLSTLEKTANISWHWLKQVQTEVMIPAFAEGRFVDGILAGFQQIKKRLPSQGVDQAVAPSVATSFGAGCAWIRPAVRINFSPATARRRTRKQAHAASESEAALAATEAAAAAAAASQTSVAKPLVTAKASVTTTPTSSSPSGSSSGIGTAAMAAAGVMLGLGLYRQSMITESTGKQGGSETRGTKPMHESDGEELMMMALDGLSDRELEVLSEHIHTLDTHRRSSLLLSMAPLSTEERAEVVRTLHGNGNSSSSLQGHAE